MVDCGQFKAVAKISIYLALNSKCFCYWYFFMFIAGHWRKDVYTFAGAAVRIVFILLLVVENERTICRTCLLSNKLYVMFVSASKSGMGGLKGLCRKFSQLCHTKINVWRTWHRVGKFRWGGRRDKGGGATRFSHWANKAWGRRRNRRM